MLDVKLLVAIPNGLALRRADRFLQFLGKPIDVHNLIILKARVVATACGR